MYWVIYRLFSSVSMMIKITHHMLSFFFAFSNRNSQRTLSVGDELTCGQTFPDVGPDTTVFLPTPPNNVRCIIVLGLKLEPFALHVAK